MNVCCALVSGRVEDDFAEGAEGLVADESADEADDSAVDEAEDLAAAEAEDLVADFAWVDADAGTPGMDAPGAETAGDFAADAARA